MPLQLKATLEPSSGSVGRQSLKSLRLERIVKVKSHPSSQKMLPQIVLNRSGFPSWASSKTSALKGHKIAQGDNLLTLDGLNGP